LQRYVCNNIKSLAGLPNGRPAFFYALLMQKEFFGNFYFIT